MLDLIENHFKWVETISSFRNKVRTWVHESAPRTDGKKCVFPVGLDSPDWLSAKYTVPIDFCNTPPVPPGP